jgi:hypothetical protein
MLKTVLFIFMSLVISSISEEITPKEHELTLEVTPSSAQLGYTKDLALNCSFVKQATSNISGVVALILYKQDDATISGFKEIAAINSAPPVLVDVTEPLDGHVSGYLSDGNAFISLEWSTPIKLAVGGYKCELHGIDHTGHPKVLTANEDISNTTVDTKLSPKAHQTRDIGLQGPQQCQAAKEHLELQLSGVLEDLNMSKEQVHQCDYGKTCLEAQLNKSQSELKYCVNTREEVLTLLNACQTITMHLIRRMNLFETMMKQCEASKSGLVVQPTSGSGVGTSQCDLTNQNLEARLNTSKTQIVLYQTTLTDLNQVLNHSNFEKEHCLASKHELLEHLNLTVLEKEECDIKQAELQSRLNISDHEKNLCETSKHELLLRLNGSSTDVIQCDELVTDLKIKLNQTEFENMLCNMAHSSLQERLKVSDNKTRICENSNQELTSLLNISRSNAHECISLQDDLRKELNNSRSQAKLCQHKLNDVSFLLNQIEQDKEECEISKLHLSVQYNLTLAEKDKCDILSNNLTKRLNASQCEHELCKTQLNASQIDNDMCQRSMLEVLKRLNTSENENKQCETEKNKLHFLFSNSTQENIQCNKQRNETNIEKVQCGINLIEIQKKLNLSEKEKEVCEILQTELKLRLNKTNTEKNQCEISQANLNERLKETLLNQTKCDVTQNILHVNLNATKLEKEHCEVLTSDLQAKLNKSQNENNLCKVSQMVVLILIVDLSEVPTPRFTHLFCFRPTSYSRVRQNILDALVICESLLRGLEVSVH